jgi:hypothetical protein
MFGTFQEEEEEPVYGITRPLQSFNPVWANFHYWMDMWRTARRTERPFDRLRLFWKPPGWKPEELGGFEAPTEVDAATYRKFDPEAPRSLKAYVLLQFILVNLVASAFLYRQATLAPAARAILALSIVAALASLGGLLEGRRWALGLELFRFLAIIPVAFWLLPPRPALALLGLGLASGLWLVRHRHSYTETVSRLVGTA